MAATLVASALAALAVSGAALPVDTFNADQSLTNVENAAVPVAAAAPVETTWSLAPVPTPEPTPVTPEITATQAAAPAVVATTADPVVPTMVGAIINGATVKLQKDWMVSLTINTGKQAFFQDVSITCGGTLIDSNWVLTAAHCFSRCDADYTLDIFGGSGSVICSSGTKEMIPADSAALINNAAGSYALVGGLNVSDAAAFEMRAFAQVIVHPQFWANGGVKNGDIAIGALPYDIALVRLDTPVTTRQPLPVNCDSTVAPKALNEYGFGYCLGPNCDQSDPMARTKLQETGYTKTVPCPTPDMDKTLFCVSGTNQLNLNTGVCSGDSGGPSVMRDSTGAEVLMGVISWTTGCANPSQWNTMTSGILRVAQHCPWIQPIVSSSVAIVAPTTVAPKPTATVPAGPTQTPAPVIVPADSCSVPSVKVPSYIVNTCTAGSAIKRGGSCQLQCGARLIPKPKSSAVKVFTCSPAKTGRASQLSPQLAPAAIPQCGCAAPGIKFLAVGASRVGASCTCPTKSGGVKIGGRAAAACSIKYTCTGAGLITQCLPNSSG